MRLIPRIALGSLGESVDAWPMLAALLDGLHAQGVRAQVFQSQAHFADDWVAHATASPDPRHLDTWLMSRDYCRRIFQEAAGACDLALVTGDFAPAGSSPVKGGSLETLCQWLDLPRLAVIDARAAARGNLPDRPPQLAGVFLDWVGSHRQFVDLQTMLNDTWKVPVLGYLPAIDASSEIASEIPHEPRRSLVMARGWHPFRSLLRRRALNLPSSSKILSEGLPPCGVPETTLQVGIAYDEAFHHYFAGALDALESRGAAVRTFSPLRDEAIPEGVDLVVLGGGRLEPHASRLAANHCLLQSLRRYIAEGGRVYAEASGMAYLCENMEVAPDSRWPMVGALPLTARLRRRFLPAAPTEVVTASTSWLARRGTPLRGYREGEWEFDQHGPVYEIAGHGPDGLAILGKHNIIGSRLYLHFAALSGLLDNVLVPRSSRLQSADF